MDDYQTLIVEQDGPILWVRLDRPEVLNAYTNAMGGELVRAFDRVLGVLELEKPVQAQTSIGVFVGCDPDPAVVARLEDRVQAKKAKDFARSDAIRDELAKMGYAIKDVAGGKVEVRRS